MAKLVILSLPELHADGVITLQADVDVVSDDGRTLPGFHRSVPVPPEMLVALVEQPDLESALAYVAAQIAVVNEAYQPARLQQAEYALYAQDVIAALGLTFPVEIPVTLPPEGVAANAAEWARRD